VTVEPESGDDYRNWHRFDYGHVYASKSFFDAGKNRRVRWTWANESDGREDDVARGWSGIQAFPRKVWLDRDGKHLLQWPIEEIESLRRKRVTLRPGTWLKPGAMEEIAGVTALQADVDAVFQIPSLEGAEPFDPNWELDAQKLCGEKCTVAWDRLG
jgi:beta-fructofuranosidase